MNQTLLKPLSDYFTYSDEQLLSFLRDNDEKAFRIIYQRYRESLLAFSITIISDAHQAIEVVHDIFVAIWEKRQSLVIHTSLKSYLFQSVKNASLKHLRKQARAKFTCCFESTEVDDTDLYSRIEAKDLEKEVNEVVNSMPDRMRTVYKLSREQDLSHRQIGNMLGITEETSKTHLKNALKTLRTQLSNLLTMVCVILQSWVNFLS